MAQVGAANIVVTVKNSIIQATDAVQADVPASMTITYSDVNEAWAGVGNINVDPLFVSTAKSDFHLAARLAGGQHRRSGSV